MFAKRIAEWLVHLTLPVSIEVRYKDETISAVQADVGCDFESIAAEIDQDANDDAANAGRTRVYKLVAIDPAGMRYVCPFRVTVNQQSNHDQQRVLADHNIELNKLLIAERRDDRKMLLDFVASLGTQLKRANEVIEKNQTQRLDFFEKLEDMKSKELDRQLEREKHEKWAEFIEKGGDTVLPLMIAMVHKFAGDKLPIALPPVDLKEIAVRKTVEGLNKSQLDALQGMLGNHWGELQDIMLSVLDGRVDVERFRKFARSLPVEVQAGMIQVLNVGQQAAMQAVFDDSQN